MCHIAGKANAEADNLSRTLISLVISALVNLDYSALTAAQSCPEVQAFRTAIRNLSPEDGVVGDSKTTLPSDLLTGTLRPIVFLYSAYKFFDALHGLSIPSIWTARKFIALKFVWHGLNKQVGFWVKQ